MEIEDYCSARSLNVLMSSSYTKYAYWNKACVVGIEHGSVEIEIQKSNQLQPFWHFDQELQKCGANLFFIETVRFFYKEIYSKLTFQSQTFSTK